MFQLLRRPRLRGHQVPRWEIFSTKCVTLQVFQVTFKASTFQKTPGAHVGNILETLGGPLDVPSVPMVFQSFSNCYYGFTKFSNFQGVHSSEATRCPGGQYLIKVCTPLGFPSNLYSLCISKNNQVFLKHQVEPQMFRVFQFVSNRFPTCTTGLSNFPTCKASTAPPNPGGKYF